jgi:hypothetical protein
MSDSHSLAMSSPGTSKWKPAVNRFFVTHVSIVDKVRSYFRERLTGVANLAKCPTAVSRRRGTSKTLNRTLSSVTAKGWH